MKKILVIGSSNIDFVIRVADMPLVGETLLGQSMERIPGGKGANQAYACGRLGGHTAFLSAVGTDGLGDAVIENLKSAGVDCSQVAYCDDRSTGLAVIYVNDAGNNSIVVVPGANGACTKEYLSSAQKRMEESDIVVAQLEVPHDGVYDAMRRAYALGKVTILNPAPAPDTLPADLYPCLHYITPNETELQKLTGFPVGSLEETRIAAAELLGRGVKNVIVTLGEKGALLKNRETEELFPAPKVSAVDTTAAGDTFNGAVAVKLAEGKDIREAICFANAAASLAVSKKGAQTSVPSREEVEAFLSENAKKSYTGQIADA